ncbi:hypothetical protein S83_070733 [Arachis hypogaea]
MEGPGRPSPPPPPLHGTNDSKKGKKRQRDPPAASARLQNPTSSAPQLPQQQQREVAIIHLGEPPVYQAANPQEFKKLVQRHTGMSPGAARAKEVPTAASTAPKAVQSSASDSSDAASEEMMKWMMQQDDPNFKIGQSSTRILSPTSLSPAQKAVQSSADGSHAALEMIREEDIPELAFKGIREEDIHELAFKIGLSPTPTTLRQISPQECRFPYSYKKAAFQGISSQFPPPFPWQNAPQDSFFSGSNRNAVLKGNSGQLPRPLQPQLPPPMRQIAPVTPAPNIAYHSSTANHSLRSIVPSISSLLPITAQYESSQQIQVPRSVPWNRSSSMWPPTEYKVDRILGSFEQIQGPSSVPSNSSFSPINELSNLPQGLSVPYRSTTISPEIQQTSEPDNLALTEDEVDRLLRILPPNALPNSSLSPINEPQGPRVPHRSLSTSTTAQTYNSSPQIQQTSAMWPLTEDEIDRMLAGFAFERQEPFPRLPPP